MRAYHERFAAELTAALPEGFDVHVDASLAVARWGTASLVRFTPTPADKRTPINPADVSEWIEQAAAALRRAMHRYTPTAETEARALLDALDTQRALAIFHAAEANRAAAPTREAV